jgi:putative cardiolipin synthase
MVNRFATILTAAAPGPLKSLAILLVLALLAACASLPPNTDREPSFALQDTGSTRLATWLRPYLDTHPGQSGFYLLTSGLDAYAARVILADTADRSIDAQYYLWHDDLVGNLLVDALLRAADRGVRVRLLIDDMALNSKKDIGVAAIDTHPNIEIRVFNPFARKSQRWLQFLSRFDDVSRRMHNKSFTADNQLTIVGGRNIGNEYFQADPDLDFADLDVFAAGPVVEEVSSSFDLYWNSATSYPVSTLIPQELTQAELDEMGKKLSDLVERERDSAYRQALVDSDLVERLKNETFEFNWGDAAVLADDPAKITSQREKTELHLVTQLRSYTEQVESELIIFSPYFVPGREGVERLRQLRQRGVRVRILTNSLASSDVSIVHAGYSKYRKYLLRDGVELYEIDKKLTREQRKSGAGSAGSSSASLHAKSFVLDRKRLFIGSLNLDPRSVVENTEIGVMIESPDIAAAMSDWFDDNVENIAFRLSLERDKRGEEIIVWHRRTESGSVRYTTEPNTSFWRRFGVGFLSLLPIESLL